MKFAEIDQEQKKPLDYKIEKALEAIETGFRVCKHTPALAFSGALALDRTPTYEPSNAPLTLEELREMDGEPVWVTTKFDVAIAVEEWALVSTELRGVLGLKNRLFFEDYGDAGWLAYRWKQ